MFSFSNATFKTCGQILWALSIFLFFFISYPSDAQTADIGIEIDSVEIASGEEIDLPLYVNTTGEPISAITTNITYDQTSIDLLNCTLNDLLGSCNITTDGVVQLAAVHVTGLQEKTHIATIRVKAKEVEWDIVPFAPATSLLGNADGARLSDITDISGDVRINLDPTAISLSDSTTNKTVLAIPFLAIIILVLILGVLLYRRLHNYTVK